MSLAIVFSLTVGSDLWSFTHERDSVYLSAFMEAASSAVQPRTSIATRSLEGAIVLFFLIYGLWTFPLAIFDSDRSMIPGDLGEARYSNYLLEHFHQFSTGKVESYWDAPFMYPYRNAIALSENMLGTAPLYSLFRRLGYDRDSAYQFWIVTMFTLNYVCCYLALVVWSKRSTISGAGAFIFAFGIHMIGQLEHAQVFPKFMIPIAFWFCWRWLHTGRAREFLFMVLAVVYQLYCCISLGFMLCYALLFLAIGYAIVERRTIWQNRPRIWKPSAIMVGIIALAAALLLPLMLPYQKAFEALGRPSFAEVEATIPRPISYFFTHPAALSWQNLSWHSQFAFEEWQSHFHFMGAIPWVAILLFPVLYWRTRIDTVRKKDLAVIGIGFALSTLFYLRIGDLTLYGFGLPGLRAIDAVDQVINVQAMYFALLTTLVFSSIGTMAWQRTIIGLCIPFLVILENKVDVSELERFNKYAARELVDRIVLDIQLQHDSTARAVAYAPARSVIPVDRDRRRNRDMHLSAMLAGQQLGIPVVNGFAGRYPGNYMEFWKHLDQPALDHWCEFNGVTSAGIRFVNNINMPILATDTVHLVASNGSYVSLNTSKDNEAIADRPEPYGWEIFVRLRLGQDRVAFIAHNDRFLSAALHHDGILLATSDRLGDMGIFTEETTQNGRIALVADNGKYVDLDTTTTRLFARADSITSGSVFLIERATK